MKLLSLAPLAGPARAALEAMGSLEVDPWIDHVPIKLHSPEELIARLAGIDVLLVEADHISSAVLEGSDLLALVTCRGDPVNVDIAAATARGIPVLRAPGRNARGVAELALGLAIALARSVVAADDDVRAGRFIVDQRLAQQRYTGREIRSMTVGIVGFGAVGREAAALFKAVGAAVVVFDPFVDAATIEAAGCRAGTLEEVLRASDCVSLHAAITDQTRGMIGASELALMKPEAMLVNTARFGLVDEQPLLDALSGGRLAAAAFDHFTGEFLPEDHPLASMPNVILTPHLGGTTRETIEEHTRLAAEGLAILLRGEAPSSLVDPSVMDAFRARIA
ncbi:MAG: NAD(P)-dependent oxidoreductase [Actinomycetota bacterium]